MHKGSQEILPTTSCQAIIQKSLMELVVFPVSTACDARIDDLSESQQRKR